MKKISVHSSVILGFWLMAKNFNDVKDFVLRYLTNPESDDDPLYFILKDVVFDLSIYKDENLYTADEISEINKQLSEINSDADSDMDDDEFDNKWKVNSIF